MNYLAHLYISKDNTGVLIGNFIADAIKGKQYENYKKEIQIGILLHREIDYFTDSHPTSKKSKRRLHDRYGHYKGVVIDIFYDHFLAKNWKFYANQSLELYTQSVYQILQENSIIFPKRIQEMLPYMISGNWLLSYASLKGIEGVLKGMHKRTQEKGHLDLAITDLQENYIELEKDFTRFFVELQHFSDEKLKEIQQDFKDK